jgi:response regulator RpfG family c-di-GMP phosphodiesterase
MKFLDFLDSRKKMLISERAAEVPCGTLGKACHGVRSLVAMVTLLWLGVRFRKFVLAARPLTLHLEKQIFPELVAKRQRWLRLILETDPDGGAAVSGKGRGSSYRFPGTNDFAFFLKKMGIKEIRLNTSLDYDQILKALLLYRHVSGLLFVGATYPCRCDSCRRKSMAGCMLAKEGLHRFCCDIRFSPDSGMLELDYTYCELILSRMVNSFVKDRSGFGDHRVFFARAPVVAGVSFLFLLVPFLFSTEDMNLITFFWLGLTMVVPGFLWFVMYLLGSFFYEKEHDELLKSEYVRQEQILARFPETNPNPLVKVGEGGEVLYANPAALDLVESFEGTLALEDILPRGYGDYVGRGAQTGRCLEEVVIDRRYLRYIISPFVGDLSAIFAGSDITDLRVTEKRLRHLNEHLEKIVDERTVQLAETQDATIVALAALAEVRDPDTGAHIERTRTYVKLLAEELRKKEPHREVLSDFMIKTLHKSAPLHDIGKVGIRDAILLKPDRLTHGEFEIMKKHAELGAKALDVAVQRLGFHSFLDVAKEIAWFHHEKWDGSGYPEGLSGEEIPLSARLMALADVYDALLSARVYKRAFSHEEAVSMICAQRGKQFDPEIVDAFVAIKERFVATAEKFKDDET